MISAHVSNWNRVSVEQPCPICSKPDWCAISDDGSTVVCARVRSEQPLGEAGYLHWLKPALKRKTRPRRTIKTVATRCFDQRHRDYQDDLQSKQVDYLADQLGVSAEALRRFEIGWRDDNPRGYSFPIQYANQEICGLQIRTLDGSKYVVRGSNTRGLFVPADIDANRVTFVTEGLSDAAALITLGFQAYARFSKSTSPTLVNGLARHLELRHLVIVGDVDADGGGTRSAQECAQYCRHFVKTELLVPPTKDVRQWVHEGATRGDVIERIDR